MFLFPFRNAKSKKARRKDKKNAVTEDSKHEVQTAADPTEKELDGTEVKEEADPLRGERETVESSEEKVVEAEEGENDHTGEHRSKAKQRQSKVLSYVWLKKKRKKDSI